MSSPLGMPTTAAGMDYLGAAAWLASDLIERFGITTALELGPNVRPLMSGADVMDRVARPGLEASGQVMLHDATATPWPIPAERYDLFVALQVFEHLGYLAAGRLRGGPPRRPPRDHLPADRVGDG